MYVSVNLTLIVCFPDRSPHSSESSSLTWRTSSRGSSATSSPTSRSSIASPTSAERAEDRRRWRSWPTAASTNKTRAARNAMKKIKLQKSRKIKLNHRNNPNGSLNWDLYGSFSWIAYLNSQNTWKQHWHWHALTQIVFFYFDLFSDKIVNEPQRRNPNSNF